MPYLTCAGHIPIKFAPVLTFGVALFALGGDYSEHFTIARAFTSMSILTLVTEPLGQVLFSIPTFFSGLSSVERIQDFIVVCESNIVSGDRAAEAQYETNRAYTDTESSVQTSPTVSGGVAAVAQDASIFIGSTDEPLLREVCISIPLDSVTIVAGKVGSGKSVFLRSLLGQLPTRGSFRPLSTSAAYCAQTTWLVNATIQENIIGQSNLDPDWYDQVTSACALDTDFRELPNGDESLVGSKGISLSGGQKQRIVSQFVICSLD